MQDFEGLMYNVCKNNLSESPNGDELANSLNVSAMLLLFSHQSFRMGGRTDIMVVNELTWNKANMILFAMTYSFHWCGHLIQIKSLILIALPVIIITFGGKGLLTEIIS